MSYLLPHLRTGWAVDQAIINEEERVVCLRFGHDHDVTCMQMDEVLAGVAEDVKNFCAVYVVDVSEVREDDGVSRSFALNRTALYCCTLLCTYIIVADMKRHTGT